MLPSGSRGVEGESTVTELELVFGYEGVREVGPVGTLGVGAEYPEVVGGVLDQILQKRELLLLSTDIFTVGQCREGP